MLQSLFSNSVAFFAFWLFACAAWHKLRDMRRFGELIAEHGWSNIGIGTQWLGRMVLCVECIIALGIAVPTSRALATLAAMAVLSVYSCLIARQLLHGRLDLDCGCAAASMDIKLSPHLLWRNAALILVLSACLQPADNELMTYLLALPLAIVLVLLYQCCEALIGNAQKLSGLRNL